MSQKRSMGKGRGRPSKLTETTMELLNEALLKGMYIEEACIHAGISRSTYYRWLAVGEDHDVEEKSSEYREFFLEVKTALAKCEIKCLNVICETIDSGNWRAAAWFLERRFPEKWGGRNRVKAHSEVESQVTLDSESTTERVKRISEILKHIPDPDDKQLDEACC